MKEKLQVSTNPHIRDKWKTNNIMSLVVIALMPTTIFGIWNFGWYAALLIAVTIASAVISEWLGGFEGLGVYMTRVKKAYAFDKMFAVIILVSLVSLALMGAVSLLKNIAMPYKRKK